MSPLVLMYNLDEPKGKGARIKLILAMMHVRFHSVTRDELALPVGALAGMCPPESTGDGEPFRDEMLVFVNFGDKMLNRFLAECRQAKIVGVALKAILTPTNMHWSSSQLHRELLREHEAMQAGRAAHDAPSEEKH